MEAARTFIMIRRARRTNAHGVSLMRASGTRSPTGCGSLRRKPSARIRRLLHPFHFETSGCRPVARACGFNGPGLNRDPRL